MSDERIKQYILKRLGFPALSSYLPSGGSLSISDIKADSDIADALAKKHSNSLDHAPGSDNQDLSGKADVGHTHTGVYESANSNIQAHVTSAHAPSNAQANADITKAEIEAKLTGEISSHSHAGGGGGLSQPQVMARSLGC